MRINKCEASYTGSKVELNVGKILKSNSKELSPQTVKSITNRVSTLLSKPKNEVERLMDSDFDKAVFLDRLTTNYFYNNPIRKDSKVQAVIDIYNSVAKPEYEHFNVVSKSQMPIEQLGEVLRLAKDKKSLGFVQIIQHDVLDGSAESAHHIVGMLKSPHKETYMKSVDDYKSYLILNIDNKDAVKQLDKLIDSGKYDRKVFDIKLSVAEMLKNKKLKSLVGGEVEFLEQNYSDEGVKLLDRLSNGYIKQQGEHKLNDKNNILMMYMSSTPENIESRLEVVDYFKNVNIIGQSNGQELNSMRLLFDKMDRDKHLSGFIHNAFGDGLKIESISELNRVADILPSKKAEIFHRNISRIVKNTNIPEREQAIKDNVENPFYLNTRVQGYKSVYAGNVRKDGLIKKVAKFVENEVNIKKSNGIKED